MIEVVNNLCVGDSADEGHLARCRPPINAVLVVAHDMVPTNDWRDKVEYMHVGLIDGPGNPLAAYHAAVLGLVALVKRAKDRRILICDHDSGRSFAIVIMYLYLLGDGPSWDEAVERLIANEKDEERGKALKQLSAKDNVHRRAFFLMDWGMMTRVLSAEVSD